MIQWVGWLWVAIKKWESRVWWEEARSGETVRLGHQDHPGLNRRLSPTGVQRFHLDVVPIPRRGLAEHKQDGCVI
jgi:hypothetical protein